ncbi:uncharacterized protein LOC127751536 [Frankliniella occidentalis]|uniref:Uncharacterized protein LOC127751536 n=1 Tax=Frankliniella occidentalis TaxID=133901 RepID=A0A9C6XUK9_FRAOC|nr:uncharacterized protein LOC127751536 [Frankliniella occidentalis]
MYEATYYYVVAEGVIICSTTSASQAVTVLYCLFFIFNMEFPQKAGHTWEFLQRYFFQNNPEEGSKNPKKKVQFGNATARVNSFIRDVVRYQLNEVNLEEEEADDL